MEQIRVLIADDHPLILEGLKSSRTRGRYGGGGKATTGPEAVRAPRTEPGCRLDGYPHAGADGVEATPHPPRRPTCASSSSPCLRTMLPSSAPSNWRLRLHAKDVDNSQPSILSAGRHAASRSSTCRLPRACSTSSAGSREEEVWPPPVPSVDQA